MNRHNYFKFFGACLFVMCLFFSCKKEQKVAVTIDTSYVVANNKYTAPVQILFTNTTSGADNYNWTFEGGTPASSTLRNPGIILFNIGGTHKVTLEAWNLDERKTKVFTLQLDSAVVINFDTTIIYNKYSPATVQITNKTTGGSTFNWSFEGGTPASSTLQQPPTITFTSVGNHTISLKVGNGRDSFSLAKVLTVEPALAADFAIAPSFEDIDDMQVPLVATLNNTTISGVNWQWTCSGASISNANEKSPFIYFANPGTYTVQLVADNFKASQTITKNITVLPNTNLRTHNNIKFCISQSQNIFPRYYSTKLRKSFTAADNLDTSGKWIDLAFFGLNQNFNFNKFISPDSTVAYGFNAIPQAQSTTFINSQELCGCGVNFTETMFDNMTNDTPLQSLTISSTVGGWKQFNDAINPRLILFQTQDGRKGVIKVKQFTQSGSNSNIIADIKIQKNY